MRRSPLVVIYLTVFIDLLGFGIILPALPFYAQRFGASGIWVGIIFAAYSSGQFISAPLLGRLSDRVGRRPVILASLLGSALSLTLAGLASGLPLLFGARLLAGLFGGSIAPAQAYIADCTKPAERAKYMGFLGAAIGLGFTLGPAIGAGLSGFGFSTAAFVAAGLAASNLLFSIFALPESWSPEHRQAKRAGRSQSSIRGALSDTTARRILLTNFVVTFAFVGLEATFALLGKERYGLDARGLGLIFTYLGLVIILVQGGLIGRLNRRFGEQALAVAGAILLGLMMIATPLAPNLVVGVVVLGFLALGQGLLGPTLSSLLSQSRGATQQGTILGLGQSLASGARAIGPVAAGWLFDRDIALPYFVGALLLLGAVWLLSSLPVLQGTPLLS